MARNPKPTRHFMMMQGPHGPFLRQLADALEKTGARVFRISLNGGDATEWAGRERHLEYRGSHRKLAAYIADCLIDHGITDLVLYGDSRPCHRMAAAAARTLGITIHYIEEGYLRPHWITYERGGVNGSSDLLGLSDADLAAADDGTPLHSAPDQWGAMWGHLWHGARYHLRVWRTSRGWTGYRSHRHASPGSDFRHAARALLSQPWRLVRRRFREGRLLRQRAPYHVVLLQLGHDASIQAHSRFDGMRPFMAEVAEAFATSAPPHHHLVFKAHPFEDGRDALHIWANELAARHGLQGRVHYLEGERLAALLDTAQSAVTVNSTAAQQALWRNLPLRAFGRAVYSRPGLVSDQPLGAFFANPRRPDHDAYHRFRRALLSTSQVPGGFYTRRGRATLLRRLPDALLAAHDPYHALRPSQNRGVEATDATVFRLLRPKV